MNYVTCPECEDEDSECAECDWPPLDEALECNESAWRGEANVNRVISNTATKPAPTTNMGQKPAPPKKMRRFTATPVGWLVVVIFAGAFSLTAITAIVHGNVLGFVFWLAVSAYLFSLLRKRQKVVGDPTHDADA